jgi:hypothetical protein
MSSDIPHACTLPAAERPIRVAELDELPGIVLGIGVPPRHASILDSLQARAGAIA